MPLLKLEEYTLYVFIVIKTYTFLPKLPLENEWMGFQAIFVHI